MNRIPAYNATNADGMLVWFAEMANRKLLFHPDDDPAEIFGIDDRKRTFTDAEVAQLRGTLGGMFASHGDEVYEAAYPIFMHAAGVRLDA